MRRAAYCLFALSPLLVLAGCTASVDGDGTYLGLIPGTYLPTCYDCGTTYVETYPAYDVYVNSYYPPAYYAEETYVEPYYEYTYVDDGYTYDDYGGTYYDAWYDDGYYADDSYYWP